MVLFHYTYDNVYIMCARMKNPFLLCFHSEPLIQVAGSTNIDDVEATDPDAIVKSNILTLISSSSACSNTN